MVKNLKIYFCILILLSCNNKHDFPEVLELKEIELVSDKLLITKIIPLASSQSNLLGPYLNVKYNKDDFWILDKDNMDAIHGFNWEGESIGYVAVKGEGPGQLDNLLDFTLSNNKIIALSNLGNEINLSTYSSDNTLLSKDRYPINCFTFCINNKEGYWLYSGYNKMAGEFRLLSIDAGGQVINSFLKNDFNENMLPLSESSFFEGDGETLFRESFKPKVYKMNESGPELKYSFSFGELQVPDAYWEMDAMSGFEMINKNGFANIEFVSENSQFVIFDIFIQKENAIWKEIILLNKDTKDVRKLKVEAEKNGHFLTPIGIENDNLLFISYAPYLVRNKDNLNISNELIMTMDAIVEEDNPVIIYAKIPNF
ncbi:6-bladed beta-propeller [Rhodonellum sp.]|uniref:6-bladed beta-propeller n=1 Tax=Rhodonellum sp. TaxID=2231180 RepID=UPI0027202C73|nr:6-bladed beta-propeller [Rhodonellum sp.]MDO9554762.1 6-bladed beta-propeller [Rhodonellum sp.]